MIPVGLWRFLHLFFAFSFVGTLVLAEWNGRAARYAGEWPQRALLFTIVQRASGIAGLGSLLATGVLGNLLSAALGYRMAIDVWLRWVNGLWILAVLVAGFVWLPAAGRLARIARAVVGGGEPDGYERALRRWRLGNAALSVLYVALLALMVLHWHS